MFSAVCDFTQSDYENFSLCKPTASERPLGTALDPTTLLERVRHLHTSRPRLSARFTPLSQLSSHDQRGGDLEETFDIDIKATVDLSDDTRTVRINNSMTSASCDVTTKPDVGTSKTTSLTEGSSLVTPPSKETSVTEAPHQEIDLVKMPTKGTNWVGMPSKVVTESIAETNAVKKPNTETSVVSKPNMGTNVVTKHCTVRKPYCGPSMMTADPQQAPVLTQKQGICAAQIPTQTQEKHIPRAPVHAQRQQDVPAAPVSAQETQEDIPAAPVLAQKQQEDSPTAPVLAQKQHDDIPAAPVLAQNQHEDIPAAPVLAQKQHEDTHTASFLTMEPVEGQTDKIVSAASHEPLLVTNHSDKEEHNRSVSSYDPIRADTPVFDVFDNMFNIINEPGPNDIEIPVHRTVYVASLGTTEPEVVNLTSTCMDDFTQDDVVDSVKQNPSLGNKKQKTCLDISEGAPVGTMIMDPPVEEASVARMKHDPLIEHPDGDSVYNKAPGVLSESVAVYERVKFTERVSISSEKHCAPTEVSGWTPMGSETMDPPMNISKMTPMGTPVKASEGPSRGSVPMEPPMKVSQGTIANSVIQGKVLEDGFICMGSVAMETPSKKAPTAVESVIKIAARALTELNSSEIQLQDQELDALRSALSVIASPTIVNRDISGALARLPQEAAGVCTYFPPLPQNAPQGNFLVEQDNVGAKSENSIWGDRSGDSGDSYAKPLRFQSLDIHATSRIAPPPGPRGDSGETHISIASIPTGYTKHVAWSMDDIEEGEIVDESSQEEDYIRGCDERLGSTKCKGGLKPLQTEIALHSKETAVNRNELDLTDKLLDEARKVMALVNAMPVQSDKPKNIASEISQANMTPRDTVIKPESKIQIHSNIITPKAGTQDHDYTSWVDSRSNFESCKRTGPRTPTYPPTYTTVEHPSGIVWPQEPGLEFRNDANTNVKFANQDRRDTSHVLPQNTTGHIKDTSDTTSPPLTTTKLLSPLQIVIPKTPQQLSRNSDSPHSGARNILLSGRMRSRCSGPRTPPLPKQRLEVVGSEGDKPEIPLLTLLPPSPARSTGSNSSTCSRGRKRRHADSWDRSHSSRYDTRDRVRASPASAVSSTQWRTPEGASVAHYFSRLHDSSPHNTPSPGLPSVTKDTKSGFSYVTRDTKSGFSNVTKDTKTGYRSVTMDTKSGFSSVNKDTKKEYHSVTKDTNSGYPSVTKDTKAAFSYVTKDMKSSAEQKEGATLSGTCSLAAKLRQISPAFPGLDKNVKSTTKHKSSHPHRPEKPRFHGRTLLYGREVPWRHIPLLQHYPLHTSLTASDPRLEKKHSDTSIYSSRKNLRNKDLVEIMNWGCSFRKVRKDNEKSSVETQKFRGDNSNQASSSLEKLSAKQPSVVDGDQVLAQPGKKEQKLSTVLSLKCTFDSFESPEIHQQMETDKINKKDKSSGMNKRGENPEINFQVKSIETRKADKSLEDNKTEKSKEVNKPWKSVEEEAHHLLDEIYANFMVKSTTRQRTTNNISPRGHMTLSSTEKSAYNQVDLLRVTNDASDCTTVKPEIFIVGREVVGDERDIQKQMPEVPLSAPQHGSTNIHKALVQTSGVLECSEKKEPSNNQASSKSSTNKNSVKEEKVESNVSTEENTKNNVQNDKLESERKLTPISSYAKTSDISTDKTTDLNRSECETPGISDTSVYELLDEIYEQSGGNVVGQGRDMKKSVPEVTLSAPQHESTNVQKALVQSSGVVKCGKKTGPTNQVENNSSANTDVSKVESKKIENNSTSSTEASTKKANVQSDKLESERMPTPTLPHGRSSDLSNTIKTTDLNRSECETPGISDTSVYELLDELYDKAALVGSETNERVESPMVSGITKGSVETPLFSGVIKGNVNVPRSETPEHCIRPIGTDGENANIANMVAPTCRDTIKSIDSKSFREYEDKTALENKVPPEQGSILQHLNQEIVTEKQIDKSDNTRLVCSNFNVRTRSKPGSDPVITTKCINIDDSGVKNQENRYVTNTFEVVNATKRKSSNNLVVSSESQTSSAITLGCLNIEDSVVETPESATVTDAFEVHTMDTIFCDSVPNSVTVSNNMSTDEVLNTKDNSKSNPPPDSKHGEDATEPLYHPLEASNSQGTPSDPSMPIMGTEKSCEESNLGSEKSLATQMVVPRSLQAKLKMHSPRQGTGMAPTKHSPRHTNVMASTNQSPRPAAFLSPTMHGKATATDSELKLPPSLHSPRKGTGLAPAKHSHRQAAVASTMHGKATPSDSDLTSAPSLQSSIATRRATLPQSATPGSELEEGEIVSPLPMIGQVAAIVQQARRDLQEKARKAQQPSTKQLHFQTDASREPSRALLKRKSSDSNVTGRQSAKLKQLDIEKDEPKQLKAVGSTVIDNRDKTNNSNPQGSKQAPSNQPSGAHGKQDVPSEKRDITLSNKYTTKNFSPVYIASNNKSIKALILDDKTATNNEQSIGNRGAHTAHSIPACQSSDGVVGPSVPEDSANNTLLRPKLKRQLSPDARSTTLETHNEQNIGSIPKLSSEKNSGSAPSVSETSAGTTRVTTPESGSETSADTTRVTTTESGSETSAGSTRVTTPESGSETSAGSTRVTTPESGSETSAGSTRVTTPESGSETSAPTSRVTTPELGSETSAPTSRVTTPESGSETSAPTSRVTTPESGSETSAPTSRVNTPESGSETGAPNNTVTTPESGSETSAEREATPESGSENISENSVTNSKSNIEIGTEHATLSQDSPRDSYKAPVYISATLAESNRGASPLFSAFKRVIPTSAHAQYQQSHNTFGSQTFASQTPVLPRLPVESPETQSDTVNDKGNRDQPSTDSIPLQQAGNTSQYKQPSNESGTSKQCPVQDIDRNRVNNRPCVAAPIAENRLQNVTHNDSQQSSSHKETNQDIDKVCTGKRLIPVNVCKSAMNSQHVSPKSSLFSPIPNPENACTLDSPETSSSRDSQEIGGVTRMSQSTASSPDLQMDLQCQTPRILPLSPVESPETDSQANRNSRPTSVRPTYKATSKGNGMRSSDDTGCSAVTSQSSVRSSYTAAIASKEIASKGNSLSSTGDTGCSAVSSQSSVNNPVTNSVSRSLLPSIDVKSAPKFAGNKSTDLNSTANRCSNDPTITSTSASKSSVYTGAGKGTVPVGSSRPSPHAVTPVFKRPISTSTGKGDVPTGPTRPSPPAVTPVSKGPVLSTGKGNASTGSTNTQPAAATPVSKGPISTSPGKGNTAASYSSAPTNTSVSAVINRISEAINKFAGKGLASVGSTKPAPNVIPTTSKRPISVSSSHGNAGNSLASTKPLPNVVTTTSKRSISVSPGQCIAVPTVSSVSKCAINKGNADLGSTYAPSSLTTTSKCALSKSNSKTAPASSSTSTCIPTSVSTSAVNKSTTKRTVPIGSLSKPSQTITSVPRSAVSKSTSVTHAYSQYSLAAFSSARSTAALSSSGTLTASESAGSKTTGKDNIKEFFNTRPNTTTASSKGPTRLSTGRANVAVSRNGAQRNPVSLISKGAVRKSAVNTNANTSSNLSVAFNSASAGNSTAHSSSSVTAYAEESTDESNITASASEDLTITFTSSSRSVSSLSGSTSQSSSDRLSLANSNPAVHRSRSPSPNNSLYIPTTRLQHMSRNANLISPFTCISRSISPDTIVRYNQGPPSPYNSQYIAASGYEDLSTNSNSPSPIMFRSVSPDTIVMYNRGPPSHDNSHYRATSGCEDMSSNANSPSPLMSRSVSPDTIVRYNQGLMPSAQRWSDYDIFQAQPRQRSSLPCSPENYISQEMLRIRRRYSPNSRQSANERDYRQSPVAFDNRESPIEWVHRQSPVTWGNGELPIEWSNRQSPVDWGNRQSPVDWGNRHSPLDWGNRQSPVDWGNHQSPVDRGNREPPADWGNRQSPIEWSNRRSPIDFCHRQLPAESDSRESAYSLNRTHQASIVSDNRQPSYSRVNRQSPYPWFNPRSPYGSPPSNRRYDN